MASRFAKIVSSSNTPFPSITTPSMKQEQPLDLITIAPVQLCPASLLIIKPQGWTPANATAIYAPYTILHLHQHAAETSLYDVWYVWSSLRYQHAQQGVYPVSVKKKQHYPICSTSPKHRSQLYPCSWTSIDLAQCPWPHRQARLHSLA
jgi:hypothetical protein